MPILKEITTLGGAKLAWHRAVKIEAGFLDPHGVAMVTVHSWPTLDDYIANGGTRFTQVNHISVPASALTSVTLDASEAAVVAAEGSILFGGALAPLPDDLTAQKALCWAVAKQTRDFRAQAPIDVGGVRFDADTKSVDNVRGAIQGMEISGAESIEWTLFDNSVRTLTLAELRQVGAAIMAQVDACYQRSREIRAEIEAAETLEQLAAITW